MVLAKDETLVKEWEYARTKSKSSWFGGTETRSTLTVTNKRLISAARSEEKVEQKEIEISSIKSLSYSHETPSKSKAMMLIIVGVVLLFVSVLLLILSTNAEGGAEAVIFGLLSLVVGICLIVAGIKRLNQGIFTLEITTKGVEGETIEIGAARMFKKLAKKIKLKIQINNEVIREIIDTLGAIIIENR